MKPNWSCTVCGMYSSRRYSVRRHIKNVHGGEGTCISFVDYVVGRRSGQYLPRSKPDLDNRVAMIQSAVRKLHIQRLAEKVLPPPGDPSYAEQANILRPMLAKKEINEVFESSSQDVSKVLE